MLKKRKIVALLLLCSVSFVSAPVNKEQPDTELIFLFEFWAYRLLAALRAMIKSSDSSKIKFTSSEFLKRPGRVQRTEIDLGKNIEICHMNLTNDVRDQMVEPDMKSLMINRRNSSK